MIVDNPTDIVACDKKLRNEFRLHDERKELYKQLYDMTEKGTHSDLSDSNNNYIPRNIRDSLKSVLDTINVDSMFYYASTSSILKEYKELLSIPVKVSFVRKKKDTVENNKNSERKLELTNEYLSIYSKYVSAIKPKVCCIFEYAKEHHPELYTQLMEGQNMKTYVPFTINLDEIEKKMTQPDVNECDMCHRTDTMTVDDGFIICNDCGYQRDETNRICSYQDVNRISITAKYSYARVTHFNDTLKAFSGNQQTTIPQQVFDDLEKQFDAHHLLYGDKSTPKEKRFARITKDHVRMFLRECDYSKQLENVTLIHSKITGKKPVDISHLTEQLIDDFNKLTELYDKMYRYKPDYKRRSFISSQYVLYQLLRNRKFDCKREDFTVLKTIDRRAFHDEVLGAVLAELNLNLYEWF